MEMGLLSKERIVIAVARMGEENPFTSFQLIIGSSSEMLTSAAITVVPGILAVIRRLASLSTTLSAMNRMTIAVANASSLRAARFAAHLLVNAILKKNVPDLKPLALRTWLVKMGLHVLMDWPA